MSKRETVLNLAFGCICTVALAIAVPFMLFYAFRLEANTTLMLRMTLFFALLYMLAYRKRNPAAALAVTAFGVLIFLWNSHAAMQSILCFSRDVADGLLSSLPSFSHLESKIIVEKGANCDHVLTALGVMTAALTAPAVISRDGRSSRGELIPTFILTWAAFLACVVQTVGDVPAWPVLLFGGAWVALALTKLSRRQGRGAWQWLMLPGAAFVLLCFVLASPMTHDRSLIDTITPQWQQMVYDYSPIKATEDGVRIVTPRPRGPLGNTAWNRRVNQADLVQVGPNPYSSVHVMSVDSANPDIVYLRGNSLGLYTGTSWKAFDESEYDGITFDETLWVRDGDTSLAPFSVRTSRECSIAYLPYDLTSMAEGMAPYLDAYVANPGLQTEYSMDIHPLISSRGLQRFPLPEGYEDFVYSHYLQIPDSTKEYLDENFSPVAASSREIILEEIRSYLENSKEYDRATRRMARGRNDFVVWFLSESDTGYCVHFASAAAIMLRYCGIPARYVSGYLVVTDANRWVNVNQGDAHAWVEYFVPGQGWFIFDPTPLGDDGDYSEVAARRENDRPEYTDEARKDTPDPEDTVGMQPFEEKEGGLPGWLVTLICIAVVYILWYFGIRLLRFIQFRRRDPNRRALAIYRWIVLICRLDGVKPPQDATDIALKARFSRDGLTDTDAAEMRRQYEVTCERMHIYSEFWRAFVANYILAI